MADGKASQTLLLARGEKKLETANCYERAQLALAKYYVSYD